MGTIKKVSSINSCNYNFDALKYFLKQAYEMNVIDAFVIREGFGYVLNTDLVVRCEMCAGTFNYVLTEDSDGSCWKIYCINSANPKINRISKSVMRLIYPTNNNTTSTYDVVKKIDSAIANGIIKSDSLYIENLCTVLEVDNTYGFEIDGSKMMERDISLLVDFSSEYASDNSSSSDYKYNMLKDTKISDDDKLSLMLTKNGIVSGADAELLEIEKFIKNIQKNIAKNSKINTNEGVTYTFDSNGCTYKHNLN